MNRVFLASGLLVLIPALFPALGTGSNDVQSRLRFEEIGEQAGVRHEHRTRRFNGLKGDVLRMFTSGGASAAVGDFDNDGLQDIFVTNSDTGYPNRLYRNEGGLRFREISDAAGVSGGNDPLSIVADALWFDYDNDGLQDLLVVRFGTPLLYRNRGDKTFENVTARASMTTFANSVTALAFDYDNDGHLDVLLGNYFKPENLLELKSHHVLPNDLDKAVNGGGVTLWRSLGDGRFEDTTQKAGFAHHTGWTLDVGHGDFDNDGDQDVYLACDYGTDRIFFNNGDGTFEDRTEKSIGIDTKKGMNAEVADYDNDGWLDIYVTNITDEYMKECNMLWHNNGDGSFTDLSQETGTCDTLWGWGAKFGDFDNDGLQDLFAVNGLRSAGPENYIPILVNMIITPGIDFTDVKNWPEIGDRSWSGFQKSKFFRNMGMHVFKEMSAEAGLDNDLDGRGVALGDFDNDGLLDIYQSNADQPSLLYHNRTSSAQNWIELEVIGTRCNRDGIGARITLQAGPLQLIREVTGGNGYSAQSGKRLHFGIGRATAVDSAEIRWPDGEIEKLKLDINQLLYLQQGKGVSSVRP